MKKAFFLLINYAKLMGGKWILWLFALLDIVAVIAQYVYPPLRLPPIVYGGLALIGFFWAGFDVYRETQAKIPAQVEARPEIAITLLEGNEYSYNFEYVSYPDKVVLNSKNISTTEPPTLPYTEIILRVRIENTGLVAVDLLNIFGKIDFDDPYSFMLPGPKSIDNLPVIFPIRVEPKGIIVCNLLAPIYPFSSLTDAQVAVRTRQIMQADTRAKGKIHIEMADQKGKTYKVQLLLDLSLRPLCDLYITHWQALHNTELMRLATG